ncbi:hypothetical protein A176_000948 [Myxococcus hansupus]|uniref:Uncharacterized protein n=1 Tax=Pseudomyxococcus hansupus TaxID=1297742 RepID=A0A0H4WKZ0_9BACT|nr:hypothetical protein [Myxococcus hansupus]AKQ64036.1 hypothetical protein A176_000948 [Myxococcus hansupus]
MPARPFRVIALAVLLPSLVAAQPATDVPHAQAQEPSPVARKRPSSKVHPPFTQAHATGDDTFPLGARLVGETVGGALIGASGLALAFLGGVLVTDRVSCPYNECAKSRKATLLGASLGMGLGAASGTYLAGSLMDAHGGFLPTLLGGLVGTGVPLTVIALTDGDLPWPALAAAYAAPVATSILAFELSHGARRKRRQSPPTGLTLVPTAAVAPGGGALGLVGTF